MGYQNRRKLYDDTIARGRTIDSGQNIAWLPSVSGKQHVCESLDMLKTVVAVMDVETYEHLFSSNILVNV